MYGQRKPAPHGKSTVHGPYGWWAYTVDEHIRMSMHEISDEDNSPPVKELEDDENEEGPGDDKPPK